MCSDEGGDQSGKGFAKNKERGKREKEEVRKSNASKREEDAACVWAS